MNAWLEVLVRLYSFPFMLVFVTALAGRTDPTWWAVFNVAVWPLVSLLSIAAHEAGHAAVGALVGVPPRVVSLGLGRELRRWNLGGVEVRLNSLPILGLTYLTSRRTTWLRLRLWLAIAAGPVATALLLAGLLAIVGARGGEPFSSLVSAPALVLLAVLTNAIMLAFNLLPLNHSSGFGLDGRSLLTIPWMKKALLAELLVADRLVDAQLAMEKRDFTAVQRILDEVLVEHPEAFGARITQSALHLETGDFERARQVLYALRREDVPHRQYGLVTSNNLAWAHFLSQQEEHRAEADALSAEVLEAMKAAPFALGTRGAVLGWLGRHAEACELLERAHVMHSDPRSRALNACTLAMSWAALKEPALARNWLGRAEQDDPKSVLLPRARTVVEAARS